MTFPRSVGVFQWLGLLLGAAVWVVEDIAGYGMSQAACATQVGDTNDFGINISVWYGTMTGLAALLVAVAFGCSVYVWRRTWGAEYGDGPPVEGWYGARRPTRMHFFAAGAMLGNLLFFTMILLNGITSAYDVCHQG